LQEHTCGPCLNESWIGEEGHRYVLPHKNPVLLVLQHAVIVAVIENSCPLFVDVLHALTAPTLTVFVIYDDVSNSLCVNATQVAMLTNSSNNGGYVMTLIARKRLMHARF